MQENTDNKKKNSLLIVDDDSIQLCVLSNILESEYTVYTAKNGEEAVEKAKEYLPDLILLDVIMPGMDGYQTVLELRKDEKTKNIPILFITSLDDEQNEIKGLSFHAIDYIHKPYNIEIVKLRIQNNIERINKLQFAEKTSFIDNLTNLPNRRSFESKISREWKQAIREQKFLSILLMDLDNFKSVNDTYGHQQGDVVLKNVSEIFTRVLKRGSDFVSRWGGEEFIALLYNTHLGDAVKIAETIRREVAKANIPYGDDQFVKITVSIGVNSECPEKNSSVEDFIKKADMALYSAKQNGRNRLFWDETDVKEA